MVLIQSRLSPDTVMHALKAAYPAEGFHVKGIGNGRHEVAPDEVSRTAEDMQRAVDEWKSGAALEHAKRVAVARVRAIAQSHMTALPFRRFATDEDAAVALGAVARTAMNRACDLIDAIGAAKTEAAIEALDLSAGWTI